MITKKDVEVVESMPKLDAECKKLREELLVETQQEEARREAWNNHFAQRQGVIRAADAKLDLAGVVKSKLTQAVPLEVRKALANAQAAVRGHADRVARARQEAMLVQTAYDRRKQEEKALGSRITMYEHEQFTTQICERNAALKEVQGEIDGLKATERKAQFAFDQAVAAIKKAAK